MDKTERDRAFQNFRTGSFRVLISSDVTARGIDIQQVSTVINFDITKCPHKYLHRIGRSGRWGRKGIAINFVTPRDMIDLKNIESHYKIKVDELVDNWTEGT
jgi:translation initiation factor 4A